MYCMYANFATNLTSLCPSFQAVPSCGTSTTSYELLYSKPGSPDAPEHYSLIPQTLLLDSPTNMTFVLNNLKPFSRYEVRMRTVGHSGSGANATLLVSNFTEPFNIRTLEAGTYVRTTSLCMLLHSCWSGNKRNI